MSCFGPQPKDIHFTVIQDVRNQKIFTFNKLEAENFDFFPDKVLKPINQLAD